MMGYHAASRRSNEEVVESLYASLSRGDTAAVAAVLAEDVDWRFHGPRRCHQHMRRLLTGEAQAGPAAAFSFAPARVTEVGAHAEWVVAEGWGEQEQEQDDDAAPVSCYWVHAWMLHAGVVTRCREYVNTAVTVRELGLGGGSTSGNGSMGQAVWRSQPMTMRIKGRSMPGLVLVI